MSLASLALEDPKAAFCIRRTLPLEGGFVDDPADPGSITNHGISLRWALQQAKVEPETVRFLDIDHDGDVDRRDIAGLTPDDAADILYQCWWRRGWYANLVPDTIAWKAFDIAVNTGPKRAAIILQTALNKCDHAIPVDQIVGPKTVLAVAAENAHDGGQLLLTLMRGLQAAFYQSLIAKEPKLVRFRSGWLKRAAA